MSMSRNSLLALVVVLLIVSVGATLAYMHERETRDTVEISVGSNGLKISR